MENIGYGVINLTCITDLGEFSVLPMSNMPASVSYDPNTNTCAPDWATQPLTLTPLAFYADKELAYNATGLAVTWQRQDGAGEPVFFNDIAVIRLSTNEPDVYDTHTIVKLRDGAPGRGTIAAVLSNEDQMIPCNAAGTPISGAFVDAVTTIAVYEGGTNVTAQWAIAVDTTTGVTGTWDGVAKTYSVTGLTTDTGGVTFTCTKSGSSAIIKKFSLVKVKTGANGVSPVIYNISPSTLAINKSVGGVLSPASVTFSASSKTGTVSSSYAGRFKIYEGNVLKYTSASNEASKEYTPAVAAKIVKCELYVAGATTTLLDTQTVVVTEDGKTGGIGPGGASGVDATNVIMGNQAEVIPCNTNGTVKAAMTLNIPFAGYKGITKVPCTATVSGLPTGITVYSNTAATPALDGRVVLAVAAGASLADRGEITLTFALSGTSIAHQFTWAKSIQAAAGDDAMLFQLFAPTGNVIVNGTNNVEITSSLIKGAVEVTSGVTYVWAKYSGTGYQAIAGQTAKALTVTPVMVETYASFRCVAAYGGKTYTAYYAVLDKSDPLDVIMYSSLILPVPNGKGIGAVYVEAVLGGKIVDPIKTKTFKEIAPAGVSGDFYYKLDRTAKTCTLMKDNGTTWVAATGSDLPTGTYEHSFVDKNGDSCSYLGNSVTMGKAIYVNAEFFNDGIGVHCKVSV